MGPLKESSKLRPLFKMHHFLQQQPFPIHVRTEKCACKLAVDCGNFFSSILTATGQKQSSNIQTNTFYSAGDSIRNLQWWLLSCSLYFTCWFRYNYFRKGMNKRTPSYKHQSSHHTQQKASPLISYLYYTSEQKRHQEEKKKEKTKNKKHIQQQNHTPLAICKK